MKFISLATLSIVTSLLLAACGGGRNGVQITEGSEWTASAPKGTATATNNASIVHINRSARVATFSNGGDFARGAFLIVTDRSGREKGALKARPRRNAGLRTADILEGNPSINDLARLANSSERSRLEKLYPDPTE